MLGWVHSKHRMLDISSQVKYFKRKMTYLEIEVMPVPASFSICLVTLLLSFELNDVDVLL